MALKITRKKGQSIVIGDGIVRITVVNVADSKVILDIEAPRDIKVIRAEIEGRENKIGRVECVHESGVSPLSSAGEERTD